MEENIFSVIGIKRHRVTVDGQGVTTLVGLAGCPLSCKYCLNKKVLSLITPKQLTCEELLKRVMKDYCYFIATHGGITFGGGEPLLQYKQIINFKKILPSDVSINIETSLNYSNEAIELLKDIVTEWIIDIKDLNDTIYEAYTGRPLDKVLENLKFISSLGLQDRCTIRVPLIPDHNTDKDRDNSIEILRNLGYKNIDRFSYTTKNIE